MIALVASATAVTIWRYDSAIGQLAADQTQRDDTSQRLEDLIESLEQSLDDAGRSTSAVASDVRLRAA